MAHKSRLAGFIIDCRDASLDEAAAFWSRALGLPVTDPDDGSIGRYTRLAKGPGELLIEVQKVEHPSGVHLDIETDDIEAEVQRLEALGATRVAFVRERWWVMQAPTGQRFCVVRPQQEQWGPGVNQWP
jgi:predicted enzyme related to lactoylglutathione lyase